MLAMLKCFFMFVFFCLIKSFQSIVQICSLHESVTSDCIFLLSKHQTHNILWDLSLKQKRLSRQLCIYELSLTIVLRSIRGITAIDKRVLTALPPSSTLMLTAVLFYLESRAKRRTAKDTKGLDTPFYPQPFVYSSLNFFTYMTKKKQFSNKVTLVLLKLTTVTGLFSLFP